MEHYRRLGFADEVRALGMPRDFPTDIAYFTRFAGHELARFSLPSAREARQLVEDTVGVLERGRAAAPLQPEIRRAAAAPPRRARSPACRCTTAGGCCASNDSRRGSSRSSSARRRPARDGAGRAISSAPTGRAARCARRSASATPAKPASRATSSAAACTLSTAACPAFYAAVPHPPAWMNVNFNRERRCLHAGGGRRQRVRLPHPAAPHEDEAR